MKKIKEIFFSLLAIALVVLIPHSGIIPIPFAYCIPVLLIVPAESYSPLGRKHRIQVDEFSHLFAGDILCERV